MKAIVLLSGGLDSTVCCQEAVAAHDLALALFFDYGQLAAPREQAAACAVAERLGVRFERVELPWLKRLCRSPLVDDTAQWPALTEEDIAQGSLATEASARCEWIPNRNAIFINIAAGYAESLGAERIIVGFNHEEAATFSDNSTAFVEAVNRSLTLSTQTAVSVIAPTGGMTKTQIVQRGRELNAPLDLIWSCYRGGQSLCWECESCLRLKRALQETGLSDWFQALSEHYGESGPGP